MLCVIRPKACQKCGGDLSLECDIYGVYIECIQCGANWTRRDVTLSILEQIQKSRKAVKARPAVAESPAARKLTNRT
jgi:hypothetical protein